MLARRGFRYRIYPTPEQAARLRQWEGALRVLWNLAHEQRLAYLRRHAKLPSAFDQINKLTGLRAAVPWMADVPRNVSAQLLVDLDSAWQRCVSRLGHRPRWKKKGRDVISITEPHPKGFRLTEAGVVFPKLGEVRAVRHRPCVGVPKRCTIVLSHRYAKSHGTVVVENLNVKGMVRGSLGRQIHSAGWSSFCSMLRYKLAATGGTLVEVQAHYSSQTCPACGVVDAASRFGEVFCCVACGHRAHADLNAAQVLLSRRNGGDAGRGGYGEVSRPVKRQLRVARRGHSTEHRLGLLKSPGLQSG